MTIEQAIQKAIEGGWNEGYTFLHFTGFENDGVLLKGKGMRSKAYIVSEILLDPLFWQALGKAMGWEAMLSCRWKQEWHRLLDWLSEGKDIESFFATLN